MWLSQNKLSGIETKIDTVDTNVDAILVDTGTTLDGKIDIIDTNVDALYAGSSIIIERTAATLPQATQTPYFTVSGRVLVTDIVGEVTIIIHSQETVLKLISNPTVGADVDICALLDCNADAVGTMYHITGTVADNMIATTSGAFTSQALPIIVAAGTIDLDTDNDSSTGETKWTLSYLPLDEGATVVVV